MNKDLKLAIFAIGLSALVGCSAVGVVASSNPQQKLADADGLLDQGRPLPAERDTERCVCTADGAQLCMRTAYAGMGCLSCQRRWQPERSLVTRAFVTHGEYEPALCEGQRVPGEVAGDLRAGGSV